MKKTNKLLSLLLVLCLLCAPMLTIVANAAGMTAPASDTAAEEWHANWIWDDSKKGDTVTEYGQKQDLYSNTWMNFRKTVTLDQVPESVVAKIAVDSRYWLYINGEMVVFEGQLKRGVNRTDTFYDNVELAPYLHEGENTIAVLAWFWGKGGQSYSNNDSGKAGFLFEAEFGNQLVVSDSSWKVMRSPGYMKQIGDGTGGGHNGLPNYRLPEYNVYFDARVLEEAGTEFWYTEDFDDSAWSNATELGAAPCEPWNDLHPRSIPLLKDFGLKEYENMADYAGYTTTKEETLAMEVPYNAQLTPYLKVEAPAGLEIDMRTDNYADPAGNGLSTRNTYVTREGVQEFEGLSWMNGQVVYYKIPAGVKIISLQYRESGYNTEFEGSFTSDDEFFNTLWEQSLRTLYITMRDNFMDCPDRERAQWWGDVTNEMMMMMYSLDTSSYDLYEKGLDTLMGWTTDNNILHTVVPCHGNDGQELPMQMLAGINGMWEYYLYTGRTEKMSEMYDYIKNYLNLWSIGANGLVNHRGGGWDWMDWGSYADVAPIENAWYFMASKVAKQFAEVLGHEEDIPQYVAKMESIKASYDTMWTDAGYYKASGNGKPDDRANALAVLSGLASEDKYPVIQDVLTNVQNSSPYMEKYVLDALCEMDRMDLAQARIKDRYANMVEGPDAYSTLWEFWDRYAGTKNHAWTGGPLITMSKYMAGVAPITPGYDTYQVKPDMGSLNQINTVVPSIKGDITVAINRSTENGTFDLSLTSPANTQAIVAIPRMDGNTRVAVGGTVLFENGMSTGAAVSGITYQSNDKDYIYFQAEPGSYAFHADVKPAGTESEYTLNIEATEGGKVLVDGAEVVTPYTATVANGTTVKVEAVSADKYVFDGWSGSIGSTDNTIEVVVNDNTNLIANFKPEAVKEYSLLKISDPDNSGITIEYDGKQSTVPSTIAVKTGETVTVKAVDVDNSLYSFVNWEGEVFSANKTLTLTVDRDISVGVNAMYQGSPNFATGATVTTTKNLGGGWDIKNIIDGNLNLGFSTDVFSSRDLTNAPHYINFNFGAPQVFDTVVLYPRTQATSVDNNTPNFPEVFDIEVSNDGVNYTVAKHVEMGNPSGAVTVSFDPQNAQYMRIKTTKLGPPANDEGSANSFRIQIMEAVVKNSNATGYNCSLELKADGAGKVKINGELKEFPLSLNYPAGTTVAIEAVPDDMNQFTGWTGSIVSADRPLYICLKQNVNLTAGFKFRGNQEEGSNLALGKTVNANNIEGVSAQWSPQYLTDGKRLSEGADAGSGVKGYTTKTYNSQNADPQPYVEIDLETVQNFNQIVLYPRTDAQTANGGTESPNFPTDFKIQVKQNGTWVDVKTVTGNPNPQGQPQTFSFETQKSQYVRVIASKLGIPTNDEFNGERTVYRMQLAEFEVYNEARTVNYALQSTITASNSDGALPMWGLDNLKDGKLTSEGLNQPNSGVKGYTSAALDSDADRNLKTPHLITIDLGEDKLINNVTLYPRTDTHAVSESSDITANFPENFNIKVKASDAKDYTVVKAVTGANDQKDQPYSCDFDAVKARFIVVETTKAGVPSFDDTGANGKSRVQLAEITVNGNPAEQEPFNPGGITISGSPLTLNSGETAAITATVDPSSLPDNSLIWTVEDENGFVSNVADLIGTNTNAPTVVGREAGTAYIVARFANGMPATAKLAVTVSDKPAIDTNKSILKYVIDYADTVIASGEVASAIPLVQAKFNAAYDNAVSVYGDPTVEQETVDQAWVLLMNAIHMLGIQQGNKDALNTLIAAASGLDLNDYQETAAFEKALADAKTVQADENAVQSEIDTAYENLNNAMNALVLKNWTQLEVVTGQANAINLDMYVEAGQKEFTDALTAANAVLADKSSTQAAIDEAVDNLLNAMLNLRLIANKDILNQVIARAEGIDLSGFSAASVAAFESAYNNAKAIQADRNLADTEENRALVQQTVTELKNAIAGLVTDDGVPFGGDSAMTSGASSAKTGEAGAAAMAVAALLLAGVAVASTRKKHSK